MAPVRVEGGPGGPAGQPWPCLLRSEALAIGPPNPVPVEESMDPDGGKRSGPPV